jgi:anti-anti-sigma factor
VPDASRVLYSDGLLTAALRSYGDQVRVIALRGELDRFGVERIRSLLFEAAGDGDGIFVVDLSELAFIDSGGIHLLVVLSRSREAGEGMRLIPSQSADVTRILDLTGVPDLVTVVEDGAAV